MEDSGGEKDRARQPCNMEFHGIENEEVMEMRKRR